MDESRVHNRELRQWVRADTEGRLVKVLVEGRIESLHRSFFNFFLRLVFFRVTIVIIRIDDSSHKFDCRHGHMTRMLEVVKRILTVHGGDACHVIM